jgi:site-specific DNA recombinase
VPKKPIAAAAYTRISSDPQGRRLGVDRQREALELLAKHLGWTIAEVYEDNDTSASKVGPRAGYDAMLAACERGERDGVLVLNVDRLTRSLSQFASFMAWRERHGVPFATTEGDNTETSGGRQVLGIKAVLAQGEAERISERVRASLEQRARRGQRHGGGDRSYGYEADGVTVIPHEAAVIRECAERILAGDSLRSVVNDLNARGVPTAGARKRRGAEPASEQPSVWVSSTLRRMLRSPRLVGRVVHRGEVVKENAWPAILTEGQHEGLVRLFEDRRVGTRGGQHVYLGTGGLVRCGLCGGPMNGRPRNGVRHYACNARPGTDYCGRLRVVAEPLEAELAERVFVALDSPRFADAVGQGADDEERAARQELVEARRRLEALEVKYALEEIGKTAYAAARRTLEDRVAAAARDVERFAQTSARALLPTSADEARSLWSARGVDWQRAVVGALMDCVVVHPVPTMGRHTFDPERVEVIWSA